MAGKWPPRSYSLQCAPGGAGTRRRTVSSAPNTANPCGRVTTRTVRHDVERLRELGHPIAARPGVTGGYRLGAGATLPPLLLDDEAGAVAIGLRAAATGRSRGSRRRRSGH